MEGAHVSVCVSNLGGAQRALDLPAGASILHVKEKVVKAFGVPLEQQRLILDTHECNDTEILAALQSHLPCVLPMPFTLIARPAWQVQWLKDIKRQMCYRNIDKDEDEYDDLFGLFGSDSDDDYDFEGYGFHLSDLPAEAQADFAVVFAAVKKWPQAFNDVLPMFRTHPQMVFHAVSGNGLILQQVAPKFRANRVLVNAAVLQNWRALEFASPRLRADREIVQNAISGNPEAFRLAAPEAQADLVVVQDALSRDWRVVRFLSIELRDMKELMLPIVAHAPAASEYLGPALSGDRDIITSAVKAWGSALQYASLELRLDMKLRRAAAEQAHSHFLERPRKNDFFNSILWNQVERSRYRYSSLWMERALKKRSLQHRRSQQEEVAVPSQQHSQHLQLQALQCRPCHELPKDQQQHVQVLEQKLGLHRRAAATADTQAHDSNVLPNADLQPPQLSEVQQLQLLISASPGKAKQRQWSDRCRLQHLRCLSQKVRKDLTNNAATALQSDQQQVFNLRRAEQKAHQLVCKNRRNASEHSKGKVQHLDWGKGCTAEALLKNELGG